MQTVTYPGERKILILEYVKILPNSQGHPTTPPNVVMGEGETLGAKKSVLKAVLLKFGLRIPGSESTGDAHYK